MQQPDGFYMAGNAPTVGYALFGYGSEAVIYYLSGTTGWISSFAGRPAVLWNPLIQTGDDSFGVRNSQFGFNVTGTTNIHIVVEACTNLAQPRWLTLQRMALTNGLVHFSDPQWTNYPCRFYGIGFP